GAARPYVHDEQLGIAENPEDVDRHQLQRQTLKNLFYKSNPLPPPMTEKEKTVTKELLAENDSNEEIDLLRKIFGREYDLITYATRDSDGDGVLDFRVGTDDGRFYEGDLDIDNDGIFNTYDID